MTDLVLIWLSTAGTVLATAALFVVLARWSVGEGSWSMLPGLALGVSAWAHRRAEPDPPRFLSPQAEEPVPPIDVEGLPLAPLESVAREPEAWVEEL